MNKKKTKNFVKYEKLVKKAHKICIKSDSNADVIVTISMSFITDS